MSTINAELLRLECEGDLDLIRDQVTMFLPAPGGTRELDRDAVEEELAAIGLHISGHPDALGRLFAEAIALQLLVRALARLSPPDDTHG
jgi:hypothetical protein